jgi:hypothetical protein
VRYAQRAGALVLAVLIVTAAAGPASPTGAATGGTEISAAAAPREIDRYARFEVTAELSPAPANPFDPAEADVELLLRDPQRRLHRVPAFWYQDHTRALVGGREVLTPRGEPVWMARFTPPTAGRWKWWWRARTAGGNAHTRPRALTVTPGDDPGFIRRSGRDRRYLVHDDGSPYFAVGENVGWYDARGTFAYDAWLDRLAAQGATFARLWMPAWAFGLEWSDTGLGDYTRRLDRAWQLDHVLDAAADRGIAVELSLQNHGAFSTAFNAQWSDNPYNRANGGPLASPGEVFTDPTARELFARRLRYVVGRWSYATNLLAWELWNESDLVDGYRTGNQVDWHRDMAATIRALDPADHLVSTSFALFVNDDVVWRDAGLDFTQLHFYSRVPVQILPNLSANIAAWVPGRIADFGRPALFAELGVDAAGPAETRAVDPEGIGIHDGLWAAPMAGSFGTAMTWWWDNLVDVEPDRYYPMFGAVARFLAGVAWDRERFAPAFAYAASPGTGRPLVARGQLGDTTALVWLKDDAFQWTTPARVEVADGLVALAGLRDGAWCGRWWDTWAGAPTGGPVAVEGGAPALLRPPPFTGDVALRLARCD